MSGIPKALSDVHSHIVLVALFSIARNTCCKPCREAALVAQSALKAVGVVAGAEQGTGNPVEPQPSPTPEEGIVERLRELERRTDEYDNGKIIVVRVQMALRDAADFIEASLRSSAERERMREALEYVLSRARGTSGRIILELHEEAKARAALSERGTGE
jgi:hypothetical protein